LANEDDHGQCGQCFECGQLYCGECNVPGTMGGIADCLTCRAPFVVAARVKVERLLRLVGRSPGRHTPMAQVNLGWMYANGTGVPQDYTEAVRLYRLIADQGHAPAQFKLAEMYHNGTGVPQDDTKAARLLKLAADQGHQAARDILGQLAAAYHAGTRVRLTGLTTAAHLNSRLGTVVQLTKPLAAGRLAVRIDGQSKIMSLSWANVQRV